MFQNNNKKIDIMTNPKVFNVMGILNIFLFVFYYYMINNLIGFTELNRKVILDYFGILYLIESIILIFYSTKLKNIKTRKAKRHIYIIINLISIVIFIIFIIGLIYLIGLLYESYSFYEVNSYFESNHILPPPRY